MESNGFRIQIEPLFKPVATTTDEKRTIQNRNYNFSSVIVRGIIENTSANSPHTHT